MFSTSMFGLNSVIGSHHRLTSKVVLVGGGAKCVGGIICRMLAAEGARIVVHHGGESARPVAEETVAGILAEGGDAITAQGDFASPAGVAKAFATGMNAFGGIDIAINTVGSLRTSFFFPKEEASQEWHDSMAAISSKVAFFLREAGKHLNADGNICTVVTSFPTEQPAVHFSYDDMKSRIGHFTRDASRNFAPRGISVNAVAPAPPEELLFHSLDDRSPLQHFKAGSGQDRRPQIEDIASLVRFLVTDGTWITGQTILAHGGLVWPHAE